MLERKQEGAKVLAKIEKNQPRVFNPLRVSGYLGEPLRKHAYSNI